MKPEDLLHLLGPYLPTDRFRACLRGQELPSETFGAALMTDISGFTPLTTRLVAEFGPQRASEELKRRLNPMFEAIAGQVFHHGGSVIRFTGDGFIAWFDDNPIGQTDPAFPPVPGVLRAAAAGMGMQSVMPLFKGLKLKVCIGEGAAYRWVVGNPEHGLIDILAGPAVQAMVALTGETQPDQTMVGADTIPALRDNNIEVQISDAGNAVVLSVPDMLAKLTRMHRWPAWAIDGDVNEILNQARPFVGSAIRQQVESGFGDYVGELRMASPMFIQFSGLSFMSSGRDALDDYIRSVQGVLANFGGRLVSVEVGDKGSVIFAVFGAPITYGDDPERAVSAALSLHDTALTSRGDVTLRIGVSRGLLYAGTIGGEVRHEYSTIGDETNVAARLMSSAKPRQILVSSAVRELISERFVFKDLAPVNVKGKVEPIPVHEPVSIKTQSHRRVHAGQFIGRMDELVQMKRLIKAVKMSLPRVLRVEGQAGVGKSRLITEFIRAATDQDSGFRAAMGDCVSLGRTIAYLPWREILVALFSLNLDLLPEENLATLDTFADENPEFAARIPLLGDVLQLPIPDSPMTAKLEGRVRRQVLSALVTELIIHFAKVQPLLVAIEDTQWIDEVSEALAIDLARRLVVEPAPVLMIFIHRPPAEADHPPDLIAALSDLHIHSRIVLDELSRTDVNTMIERYLDASIPVELSKFVYDRAQGNPFFVQEVIDTLLETGYIRAVGSRVFIERDLQTCDLPQTVQGLVQARIDRLSEIDKLVLKVAAVIGREFQVKVLASSIPIPMEYQELLNRLRTLEERDFSHQELSEPDLTYLFKHAITQEVTYQTLLFAQRRQLHMAVATTLELVVPDATERLAYHFARSGDNERAKQYLIKAGQKAFREYANQSALAYFTQALEFASSDEERFDFTGQRIGVMLRLGDMQGVQAELLHIQHFANQYDRADWKAIVHLSWAHYHGQTSAWAQSAEEANHAIRLAEELHNDVLAWDAYVLLRGTYIRMNRRDAAEELSKPMQIIAERSHDARLGIELALLDIESLYEIAPAMAIRGASEALKDAQKIQDPVLEAECWEIMGSLFLRENDLIAALDASRQEISLLRQIGDRRREGLTLNQIGISLIKLGQISEGNNHLLDAYKILHQIGERAGEATSLVYLGQIAYHYKGYDEALAYLKRGLALQQTLNAGGDAGLTLFYMGNAYIAKLEYDEATKAFDEARVLLLANEQAHYVNEIATGLAEIDMARGQLAAARDHISPLLIRLTEEQISDLFMPGLAYWRTIEVLKRLSDMDQVETLLQAFQREASRILRKMPDRTWQTDYIKNVWYHAALWGDSPVKVTLESDEKR
jgi:class 3 adenylate cyclase/tetratricopeptide (TPR) repeat protein